MVHRTFPVRSIRQERIKGNMVKHHWHEEVELLYFSGGEFCLEVNMERFIISEECFYCYYKSGIKNPQLKRTSEDAFLIVSIYTILCLLKETVLFTLPKNISLKQFSHI